MLKCVQIKQKFRLILSIIVSIALKATIFNFINTLSYLVVIQNKQKHVYNVENKYFNKYRKFFVFCNNYIYLKRKKFIG